MPLELWMEISLVQVDGDAMGDCSKTRRCFVGPREEKLKLWMVQVTFLVGACWSILRAEPRAGGGRSTLSVMKVGLEMLKVLVARSIRSWLMNATP